MDAEADNIIGLYRRHATAWDQARGEQLREGEWLERFLALVSPGEEVLDLGCGSGRPISQHLAQQGRRVIGVDAAPELISLCRLRLPDQTWVVADMRSLDLGRRFGGILAWHSLFHLTPEDQEAMFPIFAAHAAPGAPLMFTSGWNRGVAIGQFQGERLYHASLDPDEYHALLKANGFKALAHKVDQDAAGAAVVWLAQKL